MLVRATKSMVCMLDYFSCFHWTPTLYLYLGCETQPRNQISMHSLYFLASQHCHLK